MATVLGVMAYALTSSIDVEAMAERRRGLVTFNTIMLLLLIPCMFITKVDPAETVKMQ